MEGTKICSEEKKRIQFTLYIDQQFSTSFALLTYLKNEEYETSSTPVDIKFSKNWQTENK